MFFFSFFMNGCFYVFFHVNGVNKTSVCDSDLLPFL